MLKEVKIDFKYSTFEIRTRYDGSTFVISKNLILDIQIGDLKKEVEFNRNSSCYVENPELLYWSIYTIAEKDFELRNLRKHMVENGEYYLNGEKIKLTEEQILDFKTREKEELNDAKKGIVFSLVSVVAMFSLGFAFWGVAKWILIFLVFISLINILVERDLKSVIFAPFQIISNFVMLPVTIISSIFLFIFFAMFSGKLEGGFRGLIHSFSLKK